MSEHIFEPAPQVEAEPPPPPVAPDQTTERPKTARELAMEAIYANREQQRAQELAFGETVTKEARERAATVDPETAAENEAAHEEEETERARQALTTPSEPVPTPPSSKQEVQAEPAPSPPPSREEPPVYPLQIGDQTVYVTQEQMAHLARQGAIANVQRQQPQPQWRPPQQQFQPPPQQTPQPVMTEDDFRSTARRIGYGSEEDAAKALQDYTAKIVNAVRAQLPQQQPFDPNVIINATLERSRLERDLETLAVEYPEIWNSNTLSATAAYELDAVRRRDAMLGQQRPNIELYRESCNNVRRAIHEQARVLMEQQTQPTADAAQTALQAAPAPQERLERKRAAPAQPTAAFGRTAVAASQPRAKSYAEIVADMQRARGQAPLR